MGSQNELKSESSANIQDNAEISSNLKASSCVLLARGVGFEPTRPLPATDLAGLPPTRLGQPRNCALTHLLDYSMGGQSVDCGTWPIFVFVL